MSNCPSGKGGIVFPLQIVGDAGPDELSLDANFEWKRCIVDIDNAGMASKVRNLAIISRGRLQQFGDASQCGRQEIGRRINCC